MSGHLSVSLKIPKRSIWSLAVLMGTALFTWAQAIGYLIPGFVEIYNMNQVASLQDIGLMWVPIIAYILLCVLIFSAINIFTNILLCRKNDPWFEVMRFAIYLLCGLGLGIIFGIIFGYTINPIVYKYSENVVFHLFYCLQWFCMVFTFLSFVGFFLITGKEEFEKQKVT